MSRKRKRRNIRPQNNVEAINQKLDDKDLKLTPQIATRQTSVDFLSSIMGMLPNPDPILKNLNKTIQVYEELLYDSRVKAVTESRKSAITSMEWGIVGDESSDEEKQFYTDLFESYGMEDTISEMLDAPLFGYKPMEIIWGTSGDSEIIPVQFVGKPPRWFEYDENNKLRYITGYGITDSVEVPEDRFIVIRKNPTYDNPYGKAALAPCYWPVVFRKNGLRFWSVFLEKYGMPFLLSKAPEGAKIKDIEELADILEDIVQDGIAVVPKEYELELAEAAEGKGKADSMHKVYLDFMNTEIAMAILGTNLTTEVQSGSLAASQSHMLVREDIVEADQKLVEGGFNELIRRTHVMNFTSEPPVFKLFEDEEIDITRVQRDEKLVAMGVDFTEEYYMDKYNLNDGEFVLKQKDSEVDNGDVE